MLSSVFRSHQIPVDLISHADKVSHSRPRPLRTFDQIYMHSGDMLVQAELVQKYLNGKDMVFLGDGDGMSMLFGILFAKGVFPLAAKPRTMTVLDFDKRILANIKRFEEKHGLSHNTVSIDCDPYNVIDALPAKHRKKYNFFYINPPYGKHNSGKSTVFWLHRCMELCNASAQGCIVIPYDESKDWSVDAMLSIQTFLCSQGFVIRDMVSSLHSYHLDDNPHLRSATLIVDRVVDKKSDYEGKELSKEDVANLYGKPRKVPHYIEVVDSKYLDDGKEDYGWKYGKENFWKA